MLNHKHSYILQVFLLSLQRQFCLLARPINRTTDTPTASSKATNIVVDSVFFVYL